LKNSNEFSQMKNFEQVNNVLGALSEQLAKYANEYPNLTQFLVGAKDAVFTFGAALAAFSVLDLLRGGKGGKSSVIGSVIETVAT
ncbi:phage tail tape measure protein, partial [Glaesserella parasuis]